METAGYFGIILSGVWSSPVYNKWGFEATFILSAVISIVIMFASYGCFPYFLNKNEEEEDIDCIETGELTSEKVTYWFLITHKEAFMAFFAAWIAYASSSYNDSTWSLELDH